MNREMSESSEDVFDENFDEHGENSGDFDGNFGELYAFQKTKSTFSDFTTYSNRPADRQSVEALFFSK